MEQYLIENAWVLILTALWTLPWKGVALWKSARFGQKKWFVALLIINTMAFLEIFYIFFIARKKSLEVAETQK